MCFNYCIHACTESPVRIWSIIQARLHYIIIPCVTAHHLVVHGPSCPFLIVARSSVIGVRKQKSENGIGNRNSESGNRSTNRHSTLDFKHLAFDILGRRAIPVYSGTSPNGPSQKRTTSLERTNTKAPVSSENRHPRKWASRMPIFTQIIRTPVPIFT